MEKNYVLFYQIFIDAKNKEIKEIVYNDEQTLSQLYPMFGSKCRGMEAISYVNQWDLVMGDEEAYYNDYDYGFYLEGFGYIHGSGILMGADDNGETASTFFGVSKMEELVRFATEEEVAKQLDWFNNNGGIQVVSWS